MNASRRPTPSRHPDRAAGPHRGGARRLRGSWPNSAGSVPRSTRVRCIHPLLKRMERNGWLRCETDPAAGLRSRRYYHLTPRGAAVLEVLREAVVELHHEVVEEAAEDARTRHTAPTSSGQPRTSKPATAATPTQSICSRQFSIHSSAGGPDGRSDGLDHAGRTRAGTDGGAAVNGTMASSMNRAPQSNREAPPRIRCRAMTRHAAPKSRTATTSDTTGPSRAGSMKVNRSSGRS